MMPENNMRKLEILAYSPANVYNKKANFRDKGVYAHD